MLANPRSKVEYCVISLSSYITKDSGVKTNDMAKRDFWDFNDEDYLELTTNPDMTYDGGHLSYEGADYVVREIDRQLHEFYGVGLE